MYACNIQHCIGGAMFSVLTSCAVDCVFEPWSGQTKDYKTGICYFYVLHSIWRRKSKDWMVGIRIMCPSGAIILPVDCCFSELSLYKIQLNKVCSSGTRWTSISYIYNYLKLFRTIINLCSNYPWSKQVMSLCSLKLQINIFLKCLGGIF